MTVKYEFLLYDVFSAIASLRLSWSRQSGIASFAATADENPHSRHDAFDVAVGRQANSKEGRERNSDNDS